MLRLLTSIVRKNLLSEILKKEKEIKASFAVIHQTVKVMVTVHDKCLKWKRC